MHIDTIVISQHLFTSTESHSHPGAFAIEKNRIAAVGSESEIRALANDKTTIIDAGESFVCPGFHDSHLHFFHSALYQSPLASHYRGTSEDDCVAHMIDIAAARPGNGWLLCQGWRESHWSPSNTPSKHSLDKAFPTRPVAMYSGDAHTLWLNSVAMEQLGIAPDAQDPEGGSYDRDDRGELTGIVREAAAMLLMPKIVDGFTQEELEGAYRGFLARLASYGITSLCDMSLMAAAGLDFVRDDIYDSLLKKGQLTCRIHMFPTLLEDMSRLEDMQTRFQGDTLRACGFKQFFDGVSSQHTAWLKDDYTNARFEGDTGRPTIDPELLRTYVLAAHQKGQAVRIHTIGDMAIHTALNIFEEALHTYGPLPNNRHHCLEHVEGFLPEDVERMGSLGVIAAVQPMHITLDPGAPEVDLGQERLPYMWPFARLLETGATLAFGTDSPVCDIAPMPGIYTATTRKTIPEGLPSEGWLPAECISAAQALRAYTHGSAYACSREDELGALAPGMLADFVILDRDITTCDPEDILATRVQATYLGGTCVFKAE